MARIIGVEIPDGKKSKISLRYIYGIGPTRAMFILNSTGIDPDKKIKDLSGEELSRIAAAIQSNFKVEGPLKQEITTNIRELSSIGTYRGYRHKVGLPVRGQRTSCNARTRKGPRKTVGVLRKKVKERIAASDKKE
ncbi:MAG: 30S ribosomal protein S13 [Candidatus Ratteibacteria bacterium]|nr:30S ribosomal protein S13 [Candidatus Ratteibacteria bacterium]